MSFLLFIVCLIWLAVIQQKVDKISKSVDFLLRNDAKPIEKQVEKTIIEEKKESVEFKSKTESVQVAPSVSKPTPSKVVSPKAENSQKTFVKKDDFELQNVFLGNIFNKIGAIAIIVAVIIFIKLVSPYFVITPLMKIILGFISGIGMVSGALYMHTKDNLKNYSEVLLGTGFAVLFITSICGYSMFHLYSSEVVLTMGVLLLLLTFVLAQRMQTPSMLVIGLLGGYLTPCFSGAEYEVVMWYLIFLNSVSLIFTLKNQRFKWINLVNLFIAMCAFLPYVVEPIKVIYPIVLWGIYIVYDILRDKTSKCDYALSIFNYIVLTFFSMILFRSSHAFLGYMLAIAAIVYVILAFCSFVSKNQLYKTYIYYMLLNIWLEVFFLLNDIHSVIVWSLIGLSLAFISAVYKQKFLVGAMHWYFSMAFIGALTAKVNGDFIIFAQYSPILNFRLLAFAFPVIGLLISSFMFKQEDKNISNLLLLSGISLGYLYVIGEINSLLTQYSKVAGGDNYNKAMLYSIVGFCYTLQTKKLYKVTNNILYNIVSWVILPISLLILFVWSAGYHSASGYLPLFNLRFGAYVMAILTSILLARWMKNEFYKYLAVILGFILVYCESAGLTHIYSNINYLISLSWVLYSGIITIAGILLNKRYLVNSGIALVILSIFRIFVFDLAKVEALYKLVAFLALGIILMLVSYIYNFHRNSSK